MQLSRDTHFMVFLLLEFIALMCSQTLHQVDTRDVDVHRLPCASEKNTVRCTLSEDHLQGSQTNLLEVVAGQMVEVHLTSNSSTQCFWEQRETSNLLLFESFERGMDGMYTVICGDERSANISVHIYSSARRPSVPQLTVSSIELYTAYFHCVSEGNPRPTITWYESESHIREGQEEIKRTEEDVAESKLNRFSFSSIKCCATNSHGEECAYIYHYELDNTKLDSEAPQILLRTGQSLALKCHKTDQDGLEMNWYFNNDTKFKGVPALFYNHMMEYYFIASVRMNDSGEYRCKSVDQQTKAVTVRVLEDDMLEILKLNKTVTIEKKDQENFCFHTEVLSHPKAQCHWITPRGIVKQCSETRYIWGESTFTLCNSEPGRYQIQLRAGRKVVMETVSLCVKDTPKVLLFQDLAQVTCMTKSVLPLSVSWMTCPSNTDFRDSSAWKKTYTDSPEHSDSEQFCHKDVVISRPLRDMNDRFVKCCTVNNYTVLSCSEQILVKRSSANSLFLVMTCSLLALALLLLSVILCYFIRKKKPGYETQIQMIQVVGPADNDYIYIDFKDFKYNQELEFPRENLELGKVLGSGAFGMVMQATAYGISKPGVSMQVAVKMLKEKHQAVEKEALMSELKMLTYIGQHVNIVNLLGACTGTGPIYLIFQFCRYGDLLNYLKNMREHFYKSLTDAFNKDRFSSLYNYQRKRNSSGFVQSGDNPYMPMTPVNREQEALLSSTDTNEDPFQKEDDEDHQTLTYEDLLSFSYQVAKGMEFLSSKNCIHRDLAARNILVTQYRLVKIGDFGLARDVENDSNYVVKGNACLPVKWMAPESIFKGLYTMQSDVWAYGILLWEIFSLGVTPYPGIKVDNTFYAMIDRGFQMERPYYASESVYKMMCHCWALEPKDRPSFTRLVAFMEHQLNDVEERLYYNVEGKKNSDSMYQNAPVTSDQQETAKEDADQSTVSESSCDTEISPSPRSVEAITYN